MFFAIADSQAQSTEDLLTPENDVERLRGLLLRHHGADTEKVLESPRAIAAPAGPDLESNRSEFLAALNAPYSSEKILLRPDELPKLLEGIETRLRESERPERRSEASLIGTTQIRRQGSLVGSSRYSLTHIGKHQFFGFTELAQGLNILGVADAQWEFELPSPEANERYLLILVAPPREEWEFHAVPASAIAQLSKPLPKWLEQASANPSSSL